MNTIPNPDSRFERQIALPDAVATMALGARLAAILQPRDVLCLIGGLGAGKTTLARGLVAAWLGHDEETPSPTYALCQIYDGEKGALWHADLYRLKQPDDALELGLVEAFESETCVIEWPDRLGPYLPTDRLDLTLAFEGESRRATMTPHGAWRTRLERLD